MASIFCEHILDQRSLSRFGCVSSVSISYLTSSVKGCSSVQADVGDEVEYILKTSDFLSLSVSKILRSRIYIEVSKWNKVHESNQVKNVSLICLTSSMKLKFVTDWPHHKAVCQERKDCVGTQSMLGCKNPTFISRDLHKTLSHFFFAALCFASLDLTLPTGSSKSYLCTNSSVKTKNSKWFHKSATTVNSNKRTNEKHQNCL